jgi:ArsR family transcriptional regulator, virulence genes transcriptional regulator
MCIPLSISLTSNLDIATLVIMDIDIALVEEKAPEAANLLKTMASAARLMILCQLLQGEQPVGDLWERSSLSQSAFSQHLAVLRRAGLVKTRKQSQSVYYSLSNDSCMQILQTLHEIYC